MAEGRGERRSRIVGRDSELARVGSLLDDALAGRGRLILCTGEAGIGKTRVAEEIAALAAARGAAVVWNRATDPGSSPPYGLWRVAVDSLGTGPADDLWSAALGPRPPSSAGSDVASSQRFELFAQLRRRLADAAEEHGLVLVVDDLQWADEASLTLLVDVGRQLRGMRVLIVATYRDGRIRLPEALATDTEIDASPCTVSGRGWWAISSPTPAFPPRLSKPLTSTFKPVATRSWYAESVEPSRSTRTPFRRECWR